MVSIACSCLCVCDRQRQQCWLFSTASISTKLPPCLPSNASNAVDSTAIHLVACVTSEEEKEDYSEDTTISCRNLAALPTGSDTVLEAFISCKPVPILRDKTFCIVVPCVWVIWSQCFEGMYCYHLQGYESMNWPITLKMRVLHFLKHQEKITQPHSAITQKP
jgi:hypothetical protein